MTVRSRLVTCSQCGGTQWDIRCHADDLQDIGTCLKCNHRQSLTEQRGKVKPLHLYTTTDVKKIRELLLKEQDGLDLVTKLPIPERQACLDHDHQSQFVRGVLHRQVNAALGKLEGVHTRYLSYWYEGTLPEFLRQAADYLEREGDSRYLHPGWLKKVCTKFSQLNEAGKKIILGELGQPLGSNGAERKKLFRKAVMSRQYTYEYLLQLIERNKS